MPPLFINFYMDVVFSTGPHSQFARAKKIPAEISPGGNQDNGEEVPSHSLT